MDDLQNLDAVLQRIESAGRALGGQTANTATIHVNAGGIGVWVAVTACVSTLVGLIIAAIFVASAQSDVRQDIRELRQTDQLLQAYINAGTPAQPQETKP